jgi:hypothetical protein
MVLQRNAVLCNAFCPFMENKMGAMVGMSAIIKFPYVVGAELDGDSLLW